MGLAKKEGRVMQKDELVIAGKTFKSRLLVGTGKYKNMAETKAAIEASGAEIVTVAVRRVDLSATGEESIYEAVPPDRYTFLPNTAGCYTAEDAVRTLRLAKELGGWNLVKLEVLGDNKTLYPDVEQTLEAAKTLVAEGFDVMAYTSDDPIAAKKLEEIGCVAVSCRWPRQSVRG
jgi:thiazole synthase